jgi:hypothetical protein
MTALLVSSVREGEKQAAKTLSKLLVVNDQDKEAFP